jgi:hypothetical protein
VVGKKLRHEAVTVAHARLLLADLRPADRDEAEAATGPADEALFDAICSSSFPTALIAPNGGLIAIYGVAPLNMLSDRGALWLMGTSLMRTYAGKVLHDARLYIAHVREHYPALVNYVDARNTESVRWLAALGFTIDPPAPYGVKQLPFHRFHMGLSDV